jgi:hypothetical protein
MLSGSWFFLSFVFFCFTLFIVVFFLFVQIGLTLLGIILVVGYVNPYLMIPTFIIALIFYKLRQFYLATSRSVKRLEGISKLIELKIDRTVTV